MRFTANMFIKDVYAISVNNENIHIPDSNSIIHLQFRRFAGCPVCSLHLQQFKKRFKELEQESIKEIVVFHTSANNVLPYTNDLPFMVIPDPQKILYKKFGVETSLLSILHIKAVAKIIWSVAVGLYNVLRKKAAMPPIRPEGGSLGLPADFLIGTDGKILALKYGKHADDNWSVDDVLYLVKKLK